MDDKEFSDKVALIAFEQLFKHQCETDIQVVRRYDLRDINTETLSEIAFSYANAMLKERNKRAR